MKYMGLALMAATLLAGTASAQEKEKRDVPELDGLLDAQSWA